MKVDEVIKIGTDPASVYAMRLTTDWMEMIIFRLFHEAQPGFPHSNTSILLKLTSFIGNVQIPLIAIVWLNLMFECLEIRFP